MEAPFALLWARHPLDDPFNRGCFGVKLRQLVCGEIEVALISNYMIDFPWLISACPELMMAKRIIVAHGQDPSAMTAEVERFTAGWPAKVRSVATADVACGVSS